MKNKMLFTTVLLFTLIFVSAPARISSVDAKIEKTREENILINPRHYGVDPVKSDTQIAIETFERLMLKFMDKTEQNYYMLSVEINDIKAQLNSMETKLDKLIPDQLLKDPNTAEN